MTIHLADMLNSMRNNRIYTAPTTSGDEITGEYLGYEILHDEWSILLHTDDLTVSLPIEDIDTVLPSAQVAETH